MVTTITTMDITIRSFGADQPGGYHLGTSITHTDIGHMGTVILTITDMATVIQITIISTMEPTITIILREIITETVTILMEQEAMV